MQNSLKFNIFLFAGLLLFLSSCLAAEFNFNKLDLSKHTSNQTVRALIKDDQGFLWLSTDSDVWRFDGYDLQSINQIAKLPLADPIKKAKKLYQDSQSALWIGTSEDGLLRYQNNALMVFAIDTASPLNSNNITAISEAADRSIWLGTDQGLHAINAAFDSQFFAFPESYTSKNSRYITSLLNLSDQDILVGTRAGLLSFDKANHVFTRLKITASDEPFVFKLFRDYEGSIWVTTNQGLFFKKITDQEFQPYQPDDLNMSITSVAVDEQHVWVGTFSNGLYKVSKSNGFIAQYQYQKGNPASLSSNTVNSLLIDDAGLLWISTFSGGVNYVDTLSLNFGFENDSQNSIHCSETNEFGSFLRDQAGMLWIASDGGLIRWDDATRQCENFNRDLDTGETYEQLNVHTIMQEGNGTLWLSTRLGLKRFDQASGLIAGLAAEALNVGTNFSVEKQPGTLLVGTWQGLHEYHVQQNQSRPVVVDNKKLQGANLYGVQTNAQQQLFFASNNGVLTLDEANVLKVYEPIQSQLPTQDVLSLLIDPSDHMYVGTFQYGLYHFDPAGRLLGHYGPNTAVAAQASIMSIQKHHSTLWLGTENGLVRLNPSAQTAHTFHQSDGLQDDYFRLNGSYHDTDGKLYFSGRNGFNAFYPQDIKINDPIADVVLTKFTRFGKTIQTGHQNNTFSLSKSINDMEVLTLGHRDYVIGFEFALLDFADPSRNQYAFKMEGLDPDWNLVDADNRRISYSNLNSGDYVFKVKAANKDGRWSPLEKSLKIEVAPAPWLTWWALASYVILTALAIGWVIYRKSQANFKITQMLRREVDKKTSTLQQQTTELQMQKQTVETLLARKSELFANLSHEFRTPLTLIIGPISELLKKTWQLSEKNSLKMINRNANRLLTMIEQLLELAKISHVEKNSFTVHPTALAVDAIVQSFQPLAKQKNITLKLSNNGNASIKTTEHAIEIVLSNLLSNAIKYTPEDGTVTVSAELPDTGTYRLQVSDTGPGLDPQQQIKIFNRFNRLESHKNIEGAGIGLSVVEEILKVNDAHIEIVSEVSHGSTFIVTFQTTDEAASTSNVNTNNTLTEQLATDVSEEIQAKQSVVIEPNQHNTTILIIDDNRDIRQFIAATLEEQYACLLASDGRAGVALAIEHIPDVIICDVMMPEMDGFQVSKIIRNDARTSHIPLLLLTALDDKKSRMRGWREHVDVYLTKPFDPNELIIQLENILVIRNILKRKAGQLIKAGEQSANTDLSLVDQKFVNQLNEVIKNNFHLSNYMRPQMASDMAVSVKQLQRKIKALIDKNPMDLLREYRLEQAAKLLKEGHQINVVAANCGFNSTSYFSQCFKAQYGFTPKKYKQICGNQSA